MSSQLVYLDESKLDDIEYIKLYLLELESFHVNDSNILELHVNALNKTRSLLYAMNAPIPGKDNIVKLFKSELIYTYNNLLVELIKKERKNHDTI